MENCFQGNSGINMAEHGQMVWHNTKKLILGHFEDFKLPDWFLKNHHFIVNNLHSWETIEMYNVWHDCGKPDCKFIDEAGRIHYPNHAAISEQVFREYFPDYGYSANLVGQDMLLHTSSYEKILEQGLSEKDLMTLLVTAFAEIHANASLFGGIENTSFKIKYKQLDRVGKKLIQCICRETSSYIYEFVRRDLVNTSHVAVQASHSLYELGKCAEKDTHPSFVFIGVENEKELMQVMEYLLNAGIQFKIFRDSMKPYDGSVTSVCTEPLTGEERNPLRHFKLLKL